MTGASQILQQKPTLRIAWTGCQPRDANLVAVVVSHPGESP